MRASLGLVALLLGSAFLAASCGNAGDTYVCSTPDVWCTEYVAGYTETAARVHCRESAAELTVGQCPSGQVARCTWAYEEQVAVGHYEERVIVGYIYQGYLDTSPVDAQTICSEGDLTTP
ncbi:MAG: hypothetical protein U0234_03625 [Sandaracinus sp.]